MTELLTRPPAAQARGTVDVTAGDSTVWWRGALAALWAVSLGSAVLVVAVLVVWATDSRSGAGAGQAIRSALQLWLIAHKVPMHVHGGVVAVAPLGLTVMLAAVVARAGAVLSRGHGVDNPMGVGVVSLAIGVPYGVLTAFVASAATSASVRPSPVAALASGLILGCLAAAWGAARGTGGVGRHAGLLPERLRAPLAAAGCAVAVLLGSGLLLSVVSLARNAGSAADAARLLGGGLVAGAALFLLDLLLLPNAAVAAIGYLSGPGFAVGTGTSVSAAAVHLGPLPSLPLLAAVPRAPATPAVWIFCLVALVAAGAAAGWRLGRDGAAPWWRSALRAGAAGAWSGVAVTALVAMADGPAGPGRMTSIGASPWQVGLSVAGEVTVVALLIVLPVKWARR